MAKELWKGNEAIAEAAIRGGCECFFGYPITPQSEVPEYMSVHLPAAGGVYFFARPLLPAFVGWLVRVASWCCRCRLFCCNAGRL